MLKKFFSLSPGNNSEDLEKSPSEKIEEELQQVLFQIRFEEKKYRLKCQIDEWDRKPLYAKKFWRRNPFQVELDNLIKNGNPDTSTSDDDSDFLSEQAKHETLEAIRVRQESRKKLEVLEKNLGLDNISQLIQSENRSKRKNYWKRLYLCAKYPGLLRKPTSSTQTNTSTTNQTTQRARGRPTDRVKVSPRESLQSSIRMNIASIYGSNSSTSSENVLSEVKKKIPSYWNIVPSWLSSEQKTVKLLLEAADKRDLNEQEMIAVERRLKRLSQYRKESLSEVEFANAQQEIENIRTAFGEMRHLKAIETFVSGAEPECKKNRVVKKRIKTLEQYQKTIADCSTPEFLNSNPQINPKNLPKTVDGLQALVYFIFQYNIEKSVSGVPGLLPISWTPEEGLKLVLTEGHPYAGLLGVLNQDFLKSSSPEVYFSVLITSIALISSTNAEDRNLLKTVLQSSFSGDQAWSKKLDTIREMLRERLPFSYFWLLEYFPGSLAAPAANTQNVETALQSMGMFAQEIISPVGLEERPLPEDCDAPEFYELRQHFFDAIEQMSRQIVGKETDSFKEGNNIIVDSGLVYDKYHKWKLSVHLMYVKSLIDWFIGHHPEDYKGEPEFPTQLKSWSQKIEAVLPGNKSKRSADPLVLNWLTLDDALKSSIPVIAGINDSACHRLVAELRGILPDGSVIFPGGNRIEIQSYNLSKMNQEFQGVFFGQLQRILTQVPEGNFKLLATHSLFEAISFSLKIEDENCKAQFNKIKGVIASAVLNGCKAIPDLSALTLDASSLPADIQSLLQQISQEVNFACEIASLAESLKRKLSFWGSPETPSSGYSQVPTSELTKNSSVTAQSGRTPSPPKESRLLSFFTGFKTSDDTPQQSPETNDKDNESVFAFSGT